MQNYNNNLDSECRALTDQESQPFNSLSVSIVKSYQCTEMFTP